MDNNGTHEKPAEPVAVLTLRRVKPGCEERFEAGLHDFIARSLHTDPSHLGGHAAAGEDTQSLAAISLISEG